MRIRLSLLGVFVLGAALAMAALLAWKSPWSFLRERNDSAQEELFGSVRDDFGPVPRALVRIKGEAAVVESDAEGRFRLNGRVQPNARITAWKDGHIIGGVNAGPSPLEVVLKRLSGSDCERYSWVDPTPDAAQKGNCANCHGQIYQEWAASGHARSATGSHFRNLFEGTDRDGKEVGWSLLRDRPEGSGVCAACHAPTAGIGANAVKAEGVAAHGVHCDYCHKISGVGDGTIGLTHGRFNLDLLRPKEGQLFFGPLDDVDRGEDAFSPLYKDSKYCASCHEGIVFGVHVYSTYSEWLASTARRDGKQCQHCHMAPTEQ